MAKHTGTKEEIEKYLRSEDLGYQKIDLPFGLSTPGAKRTKTADFIFKDVKGKSVLDLGCWLGYFCFESLDRGAAKAVGLELNDQRREQADQLAKFKDVHAEFRKHDIDAGLPKEKFDYTLVLNILHHLSNPIQTLHELMDITQDRLVIEFAGFGKKDTKKFGYSKNFTRLKKYPLMWVGEGNGYYLGKGQKYFFTLPALRNILLVQRHLFAKFDVIDSGFKDRQLLIAHRRKIDHLVVVAGPTSSGKSTFIHRLRKGDFPDIAKTLDISSLEGFDLISADEIISYKKVHVPELILHYDTLLPLMEEDTWSYARDPALDLIQCAKRVSIISLYTSPEQIRKQLVKSEFDNKRPEQKVDLFKLWKKMPNFIQNLSLTITRFLRKRSRYMDMKFKSIVTLPRHKRVYDFYQVDKNVESVYSDWRSFCKTIKTSDSITVEIGDKVKILKNHQ